MLIAIKKSERYNKTGQFFLMKASIIIPVYNEEASIVDCLQSIAKQTIKDLEVIIVDDGSSDGTLKVIAAHQSQITNLTVLEQKHQGPGAARNLAVSRANGEILVFIDADMEFEPDFLSNLVAPIEKGRCIGTFSKEEYLLNKTSALARCWNLNLGRRAEEMVPADYPAQAPVFRAILKSEFDRAGGFEVNVGYTDDWSLSKKLNKKAEAAPGAVFFHRNPDNLTEVWKQARWFGKNEFLTKSLVRKLYNLVRYFPLLSLFKGIYGSVVYREPEFLVFKIVYDSAVFTSVFYSFLNEQNAK